MARTALITGGNSGIGLAAAIGLARRGWQIAITSRDQHRGEQALERIRAVGADAQLLQLDLASFASVRRCAADALEQLPRIDTLINNAGVNVSERVITEDGIERTLQVNHFGHFLLTGLLLERLLESDDPRVVNVSSMLHQRANGFPLDDLMLDHRWGRVYPYAASKLANILFTSELQARYGARGLTTIAVHPGGVRTHLGRDGDLRGLFGLAWRAMQTFLLSPQQGAAPVTAAAIDEEMRNHGGAYFHRSKRREPSAAAQDPAAADALWRISCEVTDASYPEFAEQSQ